MVRTITPQLLYDRLRGEDELHLIDTRPADVHEGWHIAGAVNFPFGEGETVSEDDLEQLDLTGDGDIATVCAKGIGSYRFAKQLEEELGRDVWVVQDGMEGWSRLYDVISIPTASPDVEIYQFQRVAKGCLGYLVCSVDTHEAVVVDPTRHTDEFELVAEDDGMTITHVIDTHVHADHISGGRQLADEVGATYHLPAAAADRDVTYDFDPLEHASVLSVGEVDVKAIHTPGHTSESTSLLVNAEAVLTGDTVFVDAVGRTELQFGEGEAQAGARDLYQSIRRSILTLPDLVTVLPGHQRVTTGDALMADAGEPIATTVGELRTELPLLGLDEGAFVDQITEALPDKPDNYERILSINSGETAPDDEDDATTLELGPNRCAATAE